MAIEQRFKKQEYSLELHTWDAKELFKFLEILVCQEQSGTYAASMAHLCWLHTLQDLGGKLYNKLQGQEEDKKTINLKVTGAEYYAAMEAFDFPIPEQIYAISFNTMLGSFHKAGLDHGLIQVQRSGSGQLLQPAVIQLGGGNQLLLDQ